MSQFEEVRQDSIAVSLFVDWLSLSNSENTEANPKNNLMSMRRSGFFKSSYQVVLQICLTGWDWLLLLSILFDF